MAAKASAQLARRFCAVCLFALPRPTVREMLQWSRERPEFAQFSMLFLFTYAFLLRLPSEALPVRARRGEYCLCREGAHAGGWALSCVVPAIVGHCRRVLGLNAQASQEQAQWQ